MTKIRFELKGDKAMKAKLKGVAGEKGMRKQARGALLDVGGVLLERMQARTPVKRGNLVRSEKIRALVSGKKENLRITLIAGGPEAPYAQKVHETHKTQSKFMESVIREAVPTAGQDLAAKIDMAEAAKATA